MDYEVHEGALSGFTVRYPYPHVLRRNYTLKPFVNDAGFIKGIDPQKMANVSFTKGEMDRLVSGFRGDYRGFQQYMETWQARPFHFVPGVRSSWLNSESRELTSACMRLLEGKLFSCVVVLSNSGDSSPSFK